MEKKKTPWTQKEVDEYGRRIIPEGQLIQGAVIVDSTVKQRMNEFIFKQIFSLQNTTDENTTDLTSSTVTTVEVAETGSPLPAGRFASERVNRLPLRTAGHSTIDSFSRYSERTEEMVMQCLEKLDNSSVEDQERIVEAIEKASVGSDSTAPSTDGGAKDSR